LCHSSDQTPLLASLSLRVTPKVFTLPPCPTWHGLCCFSGCISYSTPDKPDSVFQDNILVVSSSPRHPNHLFFHFLQVSTQIQPAPGTSCSLQWWSSFYKLHISHVYFVYYLSSYKKTNSYINLIFVKYSQFYSLPIPRSLKL
jgi:hypothetical protein